MTDNPFKQMIFGNIFLIICLAFYLAWWILAFNPWRPIKGGASALLLIPAFISGISAISLIISASRLQEGNPALFPGAAAPLCGLIIYLFLFFLTAGPLKRPVTSELFLIVGWTVLVFCEVNAMYSCGLGEKLSVFLLTLISFSFIFSILCYLKYYKLDALKGWICGMIPLVLALLNMTALTAASLVKK